MSPCECEEVLKKILEISEQLGTLLGKYDPIADSVSHPMGHGSGSTKPGGHYKEIKDFQRGLGDRVDRYWRECGNPPDPCHRQKLRDAGTRAHTPIEEPLQPADPFLKLLLLGLIPAKMSAPAAAAPIAPEAPAVVPNILRPAA